MTSSEVLQNTTESQGHGKSLEREILCNCLNFSKEKIDNYLHTEKYHPELCLANDR